MYKQNEKKHKFDFNWFKDNSETIKEFEDFTEVKLSFFY